MSKKPKIPRKQYRKTFVREWRNHRGLTLEQLAERIEMKASSLSYLERGQSGYTQGTLELIADALQTDAASLIMRNPQDQEAIWTLWDSASETQKLQISDVVRALRKAG